MLKHFGLGVIAVALIGGQAPADPAARHSEAAQRAQKAGDFATAIREYKALASMLPDVAEIHSNLGVAYFFNKQRNEAITSFERALQLNPDLISALIFSGIAHHDLARSNRAIELLEHAVKVKSGDPLARMWLGFSYSTESRFQEAVKEFTAVAELQPDNVDAWYGLGNAYLELGRQKARRLAEIAPDGAGIWRLAGDMWQLRGDDAKAQLLYEEAKKRKSGPDEDSAYRAATDVRQRSQSAFERIAAIAPNSHRARQVVAESLAAQRRTVEAINEYRAVLKLKPDLSGIHTEIGDLLMSEGKAPEALQEFRSELRNRSNDAALYYRIGRALAIVGEDKAAEEALRTSMKVGPAPPRALKELAKLQIRQGLYAKSIESLTRYIDSARDDASAHYLLMRAYTALGNSASATRHRTRFQEISDREKKQASLQEALSLFQKKQEPPE